MRKNWWVLLLGVCLIAGLLAMGNEDRRTEHFYSPEFDVSVSLNMSAEEADKIENGYEVFLVDPDTRVELHLGTVYGRKTAAEKITSRSGYKTLPWWPVPPNGRVEGIWLVDVENLP